MFNSDKIMTKQISFAEAEKARQAKLAKPARSLDQILAEIDANNKTAASQKKVATASTATTTVIATPAAPLAPEAPKVEVKVAGIPDFIQEKIDAKKGKDGDKDEDKKEEKGDKKEEKKDVEEACMASTAKTLKIAKKLDFRPWSSNEIVAAWGQHGSMDKCVVNVQGKTSDPLTYCGLLQIASTEASKMIKAASVAAPKTQASVAAPKPPQFKKIAKMTEKEKSFLSEYYSKLYGQEYVSALLEKY